MFDEGFHGPGQVGPEVEAVALAVLDEGIGDAAEFASARPLRAPVGRLCRSAPVVELEVTFGEAFEVDGFGDGPEQFEALQGPVVQGVARGVEAEALEDGLLPVERKVVGVFRDDEFGGEAEGGDAAGERTGGCGCDEGRKGAVVLATEFWPDGAPFDEAGGNVVEEFGDFLTNEFELIFLFFVAFGEEGPGFEAADDEVGGEGGEAVVRLPHVAGFHAEENA